MSECARPFEVKEKRAGSFLWTNRIQSTTGANLVDRQRANGSAMSGLDGIEKKEKVGSPAQSSSGID